MFFKIILFVLTISICGCCSEPRYTITSETRTSYYPYASQKIEKVDFSMQFKKEWWKMFENNLLFVITFFVVIFVGFVSAKGVESWLF